MNFANESTRILWPLRCLPRRSSAKAGAKRSPDVFGKRAPRSSQRRGYS